MLKKPTGSDAPTNSWVWPQTHGAQLHLCAISAAVPQTGCWIRINPAQESPNRTGPTEPGRTGPGWSRVRTLGRRGGFISSIGPESSSPVRTVWLSDGLARAPRPSLLQTHLRSEHPARDRRHLGGLCPAPACPSDHQRALSLRTTMLVFLKSVSLCSRVPGDEGVRFSPWGGSGPGSVMVNRRPTCLRQHWWCVSSSCCCFLQSKVSLRHIWNFVPLDSNRTAGSDIKQQSCPFWASQPKDKT